MFQSQNFNRLGKRLVAVKLFRWVKAQWLLYVPPASEFKNCTLLTERIYIFTISSLNNVNRKAFVIEMKCVFFEFGSICICFWPGM
jgi:hypothetical protein